jgi:hypothetical protein
VATGTEKARRVKSHQHHHDQAESAQAADHEALYSDDGVDLTLIRWMLALTPTERLQVLQEQAWSLARLCHAVSR